jgi:hypothetical protein
MNPRAYVATAALLFCAATGLVASGDQPDHLVPLRHDVGESAEYRRLIYKHLLVTPAQFGRMIYEPGFYEPEWAVSVFVADHSHRITVTKSRRSIWIALAGDKDERPRYKPIRTSRKDVVISGELALGVQRAWATMLSRTRPEEERFIFMDAPTVEFTLGSQRGEITPPRKGLTMEMFEIGGALAKLCDMSPEQRTTEEKKLIRRLAAFERKARGA